eukprot:3213653-Pleurochrysis_carterae.AAC.5
MNIAKTEGLAGLYAGVTPAVARHIPYTGFRAIGAPRARASLSRVFQVVPLMHCLAAFSPSRRMRHLLTLKSSLVAYLSPQSPPSSLPLGNCFLPQASFHRSTSAQYCSQYTACLLSKPSGAPAPPPLPAGYEYIRAIFCGDKPKDQAPLLAKMAAGMTAGAIGQARDPPPLLPSARSSREMPAWSHGARKEYSSSGS